MHELLGRQMDEWVAGWMDRLRNTEVVRCVDE